jgi:hypothetical protein
MDLAPTLDDEAHPLEDLWWTFRALVTYVFNTWGVPYLTGNGGKIHKTQRAHLLVWLKSLEDFARRLIFLRAAELAPGLEVPDLPKPPAVPGVPDVPEIGAAPALPSSVSLRFSLPRGESPFDALDRFDSLKLETERSDFYDVLPLSQRLGALTRFLAKPEPAARRLAEKLLRIHFDERDKLLDVLLSPPKKRKGLSPADGALLETLDKARAAAARFRGSG